MRLEISFWAGNSPITFWRWQLLLGVYWQVSSKRLGKPHLCLALDFELMTPKGLDKDGFPLRTVPPLVTVI